MNLQGFLLLQTGFCSAARCEAAGFPVAADSFLLHSQEWNCSFAVRLEGGCHWPKTAPAVVDFLLRMSATSFSNSQGNIAQKNHNSEDNISHKKAQENPQLRGQHITKKSTTKSTKKTQLRGQHITKKAQENPQLRGQHITKKITTKSTKNTTTPRTTYHKKKHMKTHNSEDNISQKNTTKSTKKETQLRGQHSTKKSTTKSTKKPQLRVQVVQPMVNYKPL